jgi:hypothetical protein
VGATQAATGCVLRRDGDHRLIALAPLAARRPGPLATEKALVELDDGAPQELSPPVRAMAWVILRCNSQAVLAVTPS